MGHKFNLDGNTMYHTKTGTAQVFEEGERENYAVLVKAGHCGRGYYLPLIVSITASSQPLAIELARQKARIKSSRAGAIIDIIKISETEKNYISYINDCDKYIHVTDNAADTCPNVLDRRIAMEEAVDFKNSGNMHRIQACEVKTSDKYSNVHVLQRHLAPRYYGSKLVYPKSINFRSVLDEYFYYATIQLGMFKNRVAPLSFYYQIYGDKNKLGIKYYNKQMHFKNGTKTISLDPSPDSIPYIEEAEKRIKKERQLREEEAKKQQEQDQKILKNKPSATDRFNARFAKYQQIKDSKTPTK